MEVARALQTSLSSQDVLTGRGGRRAGGDRRRTRDSCCCAHADELEMRVARDRQACHSGRKRSAGAAAADPQGAAPAPRTAIDELRPGRSGRREARALRGRSRPSQRGLRAAGAHTRRRDAGNEHAFGRQRDGWRAVHGLAACTRRISRREIVSCCRRWRLKLRPSSKTRACSKRSAAKQKIEEELKRRAADPAEPAIRVVFRRAGWFLACRQQRARHSKWAAITSMS